jgi:LysR family transcriptional activator of nhaA
MINFKHLRYFQAVAHEGQLVRAAQRLNLSQSALSTQIRQLEAQLGHDLFERRGRALILTEAGRIALDHADEIFSVGEELVSALQSRPGSTRLTLRVGAQATLSRNFQDALLQPVLAKGDVQLSLQSGSMDELLSALAAHNLDLVLASHEPPATPDQAWTAHRLSEQTISLVGTPRRVDAGGGLKELLATQPLILPSRRSAIRSGFDALMFRWGLQPTIAAEVDDMAMLRLLARSDAGLGVAPAIVVRDELTSGRLKEAGPLPGLVEAFFAITIERRFANPLVAELINAPPAG